MGYWDKAKADCYLLPGRVRGGQGFNHGATISLSWLRAKVKQLAIYLGLEPKEFSGHSLRAGGGYGSFRQEGGLLSYQEDGKVEE